MDLGQFAYDPRSSQGPPAMPTYWSGGGGGGGGRRRARAKWDALGDDIVTHVFEFLNDWELAKLARMDRRTHALAKAAIQRKLKLSPSQWEAFCAVVERRESVLIMGPPGSGKSFLLNILKTRMRRPLVTASTGAAAEKIEAQTFHSAFCLGLGGNSLHQIMAKPPFCRTQITTCRSIIIDEISMLSDKILTLAEAVVRQTLGGMPQLVASGDPMQLSAVAALTEGPFYASKLIKGLRPYILKESHRQGGGGKFLRVLNRARLGEARIQDVNWLRNHSMPADKATHEPPRLFCTLRETHAYNDSAMARLPGEEAIFTLSATGTPVALSKWSSTLPGEVALKVGARVILLINLRSGTGLHNGSTGTVLAMHETSVFVQFDNGMRQSIGKHRTELVKDEKVVASRTQLPLLVAFAVSVHRAQGATLDSLVLDLTSCFAAGQAYVALSRVRKVSDVHIRGLTLRALNMVDTNALQFYEKTAARAHRHHLARRESQRKRTEVDFFGGLHDDELVAMVERAERAHAAR